LSLAIREAHSFLFIGTIVLYPPKGDDDQQPQERTDRNNKSGSRRR
jgi:hypothetical protein